jgi:hypothetical protein
MRTLSVANMLLPGGNPAGGTHLGRKAVPYVASEALM